MLPAMEPLELWADALSLKDAWWFHGPEEQKVQYREAGRNPQLTVYLEEMMRRDLIHRIHRGELFCLGVKTAPDLGDGPEILPRHLFATPEIDWIKSTIRAFGWVYEGVRVVLPEQAREIERSQPEPAIRRGRPPVSDKIREVVRDLKEAGQLDGLLRKEQENLARSRARERYPLSFPKETQPSRTTILEALKAEGLSSADLASVQKVHKVQKP
jgi:hypothetical protein